MRASEIKKGVWWVGAVDWNLRNFHGYTTEAGSSYNAYLIVDEKIALVDTVKAPFAGEMLARIADVIDPAKIDYLISNHVEQDHSGAIPAVLELAKNAKVVTSSPQGVKGLAMHFGDSLPLLPVKAGDELSLGSRTIRFVPTPMLHWPDNMVAYCPEEKLLFSNDAFGQHYASSARFDDEGDLCEIMHQAMKYYANIVMPYAGQVRRALDAASGLDIDVVAPSHGVIWRSHIAEILRAYDLWSSDGAAQGAMVVYDSMWGATEEMARWICEAFTESGIDAKLIDLKYTHISDVICDVLHSKFVAVGSPTLNSRMLPTVAAFLNYLGGLTPKKRIGFAFGSYGWGGQSIGEVEDALVKCGYELLAEKAAVQFRPTGDFLAALKTRVAEAAALKGRAE